MKTKTLRELIPEAAGRERALILPEGQRTYRNWPLCLTCGREVDSAELVNVNSKGCDIVAKHHGSEDSVHVTWTVPFSDQSANPLSDRNIGWQVKRALADSAFFDPAHGFDYARK